MLERFKTMDRQTRIALVLAAVVGLLFFGAVAGVIRQAGWNEGFLFGLMAGNGDGIKAVAPHLSDRGAYSMHGWGGHGWGWHPFGFIGGIFRFFFFAFLIMLFFKFLGFMRWRTHGGHFCGPRGPWGHGPHGRWGEQPEPPKAEPAPQRPEQPGENQPQNTSWTML